MRERALAAELEHLNCQAKSGRGLITWPVKRPLWFGVNCNFPVTGREARAHLLSPGIGVQALPSLPTPMPDIPRGASLDPLTTHVRQAGKWVHKSHMLGLCDMCPLVIGK